MGKETTADTVENEGLLSSAFSVVRGYWEWQKAQGGTPKAQFTEKTTEKTNSEASAKPVATDVDPTIFAIGTLPPNPTVIQDSPTTTIKVDTADTKTDSPYNTEHENFSQDNILAQQNLIALGFTDLGAYGQHKDGVDGIDGPKTSAELTRYQQEFKLEVTGDVNAETLAHMEQLKISRGVEYETPSAFDRGLDKAESFLSAAYNKARDFINVDNRPIHLRVVDSPIVRETSEWHEPRVKKDGTAYKHGGVDYAGTEAGDQPDILAAEGGIVKRVDNHPNGFGQFVEVAHGTDGKFSLIYAHLDKGSSLKEGATINAGDFIERMGNTGTSTGVHLHLEARYNGMKFDPKHFDKALEQGYLSPEMMPNMKLTLKVIHTLPSHKAR